MNNNNNNHHNMANGNYANGNYYNTSNNTAMQQPNGMQNRSTNRPTNEGGMGGYVLPLLGGAALGAAGLAMMSHYGHEQQGEQQQQQQQQQYYDNSNNVQDTGYDDAGDFGGFGDY
jgi:uncharacterized protein HemX